MKKVLFVCHGNICRSPMAEFVLKDLADKAGIRDALVIDSAATSTEEIGSDIHYGTRDVLNKHSISFSKRAARQITKNDYEKYDYLVGMDAANIKNMLRIFGGDGDKKIFRLLDFTDFCRDVADPWYTHNFDITYDDISQGCKTLLERIKSEL